MRLSIILDKMPENIEHVWVTNLPNFSIEKVKVDKVVREKNGDYTIKVEDSSIYGNNITVRKSKLGYQMKKSYHLEEAHAALRMRDHYRKLLAEEKDSATTFIVSVTKDKETMIENIDKFTTAYPEMTI